MPQPVSSPATFFPGGGEMGERVRALDWEKTPIGRVESWPQSLRTAVRIILDSRFPMFVWWGDDLVNIYNDSYIDVLGQRHPDALGKPAPQIWGEIWDTIGPLARTVVDENQATFNTELELFMERNGYVEETFFTFSYSPLRDTESGPRGLFCACFEDTERVIGQRRLRLLRALGGSSRTVHTVAEALDVAARSFERYRRDVAFALIYRQQDDALVLARATDGAEELGPAQVALTVSAPESGPGIGDDVLRAVFSDGQARPLEAADLGLPMPGGAWPEAANSVMILPLTRGGEERIGVLVLGASPRRPFDDGYRQFFDLVANAVSSLITNADAYENERRRADALAELDRAKTLFFGNVSHEFRTPLTLMMAPIEDLLLDADASPAMLEQLQIARRNGLRLVKLVNTLLDFSRIEAGRITAQYAPVDLAAATAELASMFRSAVETAGLRLEVDCPPLDEPVYVDHDMWEKIVMNLLSNALKYTLDGDIRVTLRQIDSDWVELRVADSGIGIPEKELPRVFDRFHRVEGAHGRTQEGTGIGLALVQELCRLHGGTVSVDSEVGQGSTFMVRIPLGTGHLPAERVGARQHLWSSRIGVQPYLEEALRWLPEEATATGSVPRSAEAPSDARQAGAERSLVVVADDNADMRTYLRRLLQQRYDVEVVSNGEQALKIIQSRLPALVLSDVMMPGLSGFELLQLLRAQPSTRAIPVVLLSARAGEEARAEGLEAGADDYIVKPFHARELLARIGAQIELATVRRGAETRITHLLEGSTTGFITLDGEGRYQYVNPAAEKLVGRTQDTLLGKTPEEAFPEARGTEILDLVKQVQETREATATESYFPPWDRWFRIKLDPTRDGGLTVQFDDVTLAHRALETMRETDRRKDEFLATLAHELRNPLAPIRNALQLLLAEHPGESQPLYQMMDRQTEHLTRLVDDLMEVSRINRGIVELRPERIEVVPAIRSACESVRPEIDSLHQRLEVEIPDQPLYVEADSVRLAQIVANLLGNASKYTPDGGHIRLSVRASDDNVVIEVADDGIGIPAEQIDTVFEPFLQAGSVSARERGGLGLGLTVVRELVTRHGGSVKALSAGPGQGATFRVTLPRREAPVGSTAEAVEAPATRSDSVRVVICDDNRDAADSMTLLLKARGCDVEVAYDGESAVAAVCAHEPQVVILDIGLPDIDGIEVARRIRARDDGKQPVLIALTGWGQDSDRAETRAAGFDHHLVKPADFAEIEAIIATHADTIEGARSSE